MSNTDKLREKPERSTPIDRKKEISIAFAMWLFSFYVPVRDYGYVAKHERGRNATVMYLGDLYDIFIKKAWK